MKVDTGQTGQREQKRKKIFAKLSEEFSFPSPSGTVMEVIRLCNSDTSSLRDIANLIQTDPALSAKIIKYSNSAFLATGIQVASLQKATVKLGMKTVVNLALGLSLLSGNKSGTCDHFDYSLFWRTSLAEALAAREIAKRSKEFDPDELFVCGLLSHMGKLSLATLFPQDYDKLLIDQPPNSPLEPDEFNSFGINSAELTAELFLSWGMPALYALGAGFHENIGYFELGTGKTQRAAVHLSLAHHIALMCQSDEPLFGLLESIVDISTKFEIDIGSFATTFQNIVESWHEHGKLFEIQTSECYSYSESDD